MTPRERAESLVEIVPLEAGRYAVRWKRGAYLSAPDDYEGAEARRVAAVDVLADVLTEAAEGGVKVRGKRFRLDCGPDPWDQPRVRLVDAAFVAGMTLLMGGIVGFLFGVYLPQAVWRTLWPF